MKTQHILTTVLVLSLCQWSVLGEGSLVSTDPKIVPLLSANDSSPITTAPSQANDESGISAPTTVSPVQDDKNTTTVTPPTPAPTTTSTTSPSPPTSSTTQTPPNNTTTQTPPTSSTTQTPPTTSSTAPPPTTTTPAPSPTPKPPRHFDTPSFIGGIVLTIGLIAIGFVAHKIYKSKFDRNYHTL